MIDLLDTPLRVTWDLHGPGGAVCDADARKVAAALVEAGVFYVTLEERPLAHPDSAEIFSILADGGCRTLAVCSGGTDELRTLESGAHPEELLLDVASFLEDGRFDSGALAHALTLLRRSVKETGLLLVPSPANLALLPELLEFCRAHGVGRFKLPNVKIDASFSRSAAERLGPADVDRLKSRLGPDATAHRAGVNLEIHDLFLWEILYPAGGEGRGEYGGCQAANSLGHVDADGWLHPCSSWPLRLGSLLEQGVAEIWASPARLAVREEIAAVPAACLGCRDYPLCLGGCRGVARAVNGHPFGRDPLCPSPR